MTEAESGPPPQGQRPSLPERVTLVLSLLIVLGLIGYIAFHHFFVESGAPRAQARILLDQAWETDGQWTVPVEILNASDLPLEEVTVQVEMSTPTGEPAEVSLTASYLPERGREEIYVVTEVEPRRAKMKATIQSFKTQKDASGY